MQKNSLVQIFINFLIDDDQKDTILKSNQRRTNRLIDIDERQQLRDERLLQSHRAASCRRLRHHPSQEGAVPRNRQRVVFWNPVFWWQQAWTLIRGKRKTAKIVNIALGSVYWVTLKNRNWVYSPV